MWFKNARLYTVKLSPELISIFKDEEKLEAAIAGTAFRPCMAQEAAFIGFSPLFGRKAPAYTFSHAGNHFFKLTEETKLLPASVIRDQLEDEVAAKEVELKRELRKTEKAALKTALVNQLMSRAFATRRELLIWVNSEHGWCAVAASSAKRAERAISLMREALGGSFPAIGLKPRCVVEDRLTHWLSAGAIPHEFKLGADAVFKGNDDEGGTIKASQADLTSDEISIHVKAGKVATELQLIFNDSLSLVLTSELTLKRMRPEDQYLEKTLPAQTEDFISDQQSILLVQADLLQQLFQSLIKAFDCE